MQKIIPLIFLLILFSPCVFSQQPGKLPEVTPAGKGIVNTRIDNIGYWKEMVQFGFVKPGLVYPVRPAIFTNSEIIGTANPYQDSPDIPISDLDSVTQSENSIFIDPEEEGMMLNSNNSSNWIDYYARDKYGADGLFSPDGALSWDGSLRGVGKENGGDPATAIDLNGRLYVGTISSDGGQSVAYSDDRGKSWHEVVVFPGPTNVYGLLDKNHLWIDNAAGSPYTGNLYDAWTNFIPGSPDTNQVQLSRSVDRGIHWSSPYTISRAVSAGKLNHGVNIQTGPMGEVYAVWSIYDTWPSDEVALGFTKSIDGGGIFTPARRIADNIKGIRASLTGKNMRVNSFPSMTVDNSNGPYRGRIYIVWTNIGIPGINTGNDIDVYLIRSDDQGETWSNPLRINQDAPGLRKQHFFPWICCDPITGGLAVIYYDDRNLTPTDCETYVSCSHDGGMSWTDMKVSDVSFTPSPIPGIAFSYFGDYIGIQSRNMKVYPIWTDNRTGNAMAYVSPFDLRPAPGQAWVVFHEYELEEIKKSTSQKMNYGDSLYLSLCLKNVGDQTAQDVQVKITSRSPYILITDSLADYGEILADSVKTILHGFSLKVSDTIPDKLNVRIDIQVSGNDTNWLSHFSIESQAPGLNIAGLRVVDSAGGNYNGHLDPGETAVLVISHNNSGAFPCDTVTGRLNTDTPLISLDKDSVSLGEIIQGQHSDAFFTATVDEDLPLGTTIFLQYQANSGKYLRKKIFRQVIGIIAEDWESNGFQKFPWQLSGNNNWTITNKLPWEGLYASASGKIGHGQTSQLSVNFYSAIEDSISFYLKTSTEVDYDFLFFYIDSTFMGAWSGVNPWTRLAFPVAGGLHHFTWRYVKDVALSFGEDKVWLDMITFPAPMLPEVSAGENDTICPGQTYRLKATASGFDSLLWNSSGDGKFDSANLLNPIYTPGPGDILNGVVHLKLNVFANYSRISKSMDLIINCDALPDPEFFPIIEIYPNPGDGRFTLEILSPHPGPLTICIYSVTNELIYMKKENICYGHWKKKFNFVSLAAGNYLMTIKTHDNTEVRKLIFVK